MTTADEGLAVSNADSLRAATSSRFDGAVHDEATPDIGNNREGERVVRLEFTSKRGTAASTTVLNLTVEAAIALRNQLDGLFDAAGIQDVEELVDPDDACPSCGERSQDALVWQDDGRIRCAKCGRVYDPDEEIERRAAQ